MMENGQGMMDDERWTMDDGRWKMEDGFRSYSVERFNLINL
ncbi:hypothetical protein ACFSNA_05280 [Pedobacter mendelii]